MNSGEGYAAIRAGILLARRELNGYMTVIEVPRENSKDKEAILKWKAFVRTLNKERGAE